MGRCALAAATPAAAQQRFDVLIRGARVLDGSGNPWYDTISAMSTPSASSLVDEVIHVSREAGDRRLASAETRARIRTEVVDNLDRRGGAARIMFGRFAADPSVEGRTLADVAAQRGADPVDVALIWCAAADRASSPSTCTTPM